MVKSSSIRTQIAQQTRFGEESFSLAHSARLRTGSYADYDKAIQTRKGSGFTKPFDPFYPPNLQDVSSSSHVVINEPVAQRPDHATHLNTSQNFSLAYKLSLLLNTQDGTRDQCCYNLGKAYIARRRDPNDVGRGIELLETLLEFPTAREEDGQNDSSSAKGDIYFYLAFGHEKLHQNDEAVKNYTAALLQYDKEQNHKQTCETHLKIANISNAERNFPEAQMNFEKAAKIYSESGEIGNSLMARICQANAAYHDKTYKESEIVKMLDTISRDTPNVRNSAFQGKIMCEAGLLYSLVHRDDSALFCYHKSIRLCSPGTRRLALACLNYGIISLKFGYPKDALEKLQRASQIYGTLRDRSLQGKSFLHLSHAQTHLELREEARESLMHALKAFEDSGEKLKQSDCQEKLGIMAYNNGNLAKARDHFKAALKCLPELELLRRERLQKLFLLLPVSNDVDGVETIPKQTWVSAVNREPLYANDVVDTVSGPNKRESPGSRTKGLDRGRRDYADENDRPVQHVARGISNVTNYTNTLSSLRRSSDLSEDYVAESSDDSSKASSSSDSSTSEGKKRVFAKRRNRNRFKKLVQTTTLPISSVASPKDKDESRKRGLNDDQNGTANADMMNFYKNQLENIPENSDSERFTNVTSSSSSVSSKQGRSKRPEAVVRNSSLRRSTDFSDEYVAETSDASTVTLSLDNSSVSDGKQKVFVKRRDRDIGRNPNDTLPTLPHRNGAPNPALQSSNTENPYATVRKTPKRQQTVPDSTSSSSTSEADDYPQSEQTTDSEPNQRPYLHRRTEDELEEIENPDTDPSVKSAEKKNKKSSSCVVM